MSDDPVRTRILGDEGWIDFQDWFVRQRAAPVVRAVEFAGAATARPQPEVLAALRARPARRGDLPEQPVHQHRADPGGAGDAGGIAASGAPVIAVSPIIAGQAVKGPTAKMFAELGTPPSAAAAAARYGGLLQGYVMEEGDDATRHRAARLPRGDTDARRWTTRWRWRGPCWPRRMRCGDALGGAAGEGDGGVEAAPLALALARGARGADAGDGGGGAGRVARRARPGRCRGGDAGCLDHGGGASAAARG